MRGPRESSRTTYRLALGLALAAAGVLGLARSGPEAHAQVGDTFATAVSIAGTDFFINGEITYEGRNEVRLESGGSANLEGLLLNARTINAVFDDDNEATQSNWEYPSGPAQDWNPDRNTSEFVAMLPEYREKGLLMVTVGLQGGNPASALAPGNGSTPSWVVGAFNSDGSLNEAWMARLATLIEAADAAGMVVNVSLFYQRQEHRFTSETAVEAAVDNATDWLVAQGYTNVIVGIQNEVGSSLWGTGIWKPDRAHELIERAKARHPSLIVGTGMRDVIPSAEIVNASDYLAFSANTMSAAETGTFIDDLHDLPSWRADPKPILVIEDGPRPSPAEMDAALARHVSFGYHDDGPSGDSFSNYEDGFQWVPASWAINTSAKRAFFDRVARLSGTASPPSSDSPYELAVTSSPDRSQPASLQGETVSGDVYVFIAPEEGVIGARFWLDDPDRSGAPVQTERSPPWDLVGGDTQQANPFDTNAVADGKHTVTAELALEGGGLEVVSAAFTVANDSAALSFSPHSLSFTVEEGSAAPAQTSSLAASDASPAAFSASANRTWVSVSPGSGSTPETISISVDVSGLTPGTYSATVTAEAAGYVAGALEVTVTVADTPYQLVVSLSPERSSPLPLAGRSVTGDVYVFLDAKASVSEVSFHLDDPEGRGSPMQVERTGPYDFAGTAADGSARPFDTTILPDGEHEVTALVRLADGSSEVVSAAFMVATLLVSASPDRSGPLPLAGASLAENAFVYMRADSGVAEVRFYRDDPERSGSRVQVERSAPYDFAGTAADGSAQPFDTTSVAAGTHTITAELDLEGGETEVVGATFTVAN